VSNHAYIVWADFFMASPVHLRLNYYRMGANYLVQRLVMDNTQASPKVSTADSNYLLMATLDLVTFRTSFPFAPLALHPLISACCGVSVCTVGVRQL
jgi:hypothetical protein